MTEPHPASVFPPVKWVQCLSPRPSVRTGGLGHPAGGEGGSALPREAGVTGEHGMMVGGSSEGTTDQPLLRLAPDLHL